MRCVELPAKGCRAGDNYWMAAFKQTKIRFFTTVIKNDDGLSAPVDNGFWQEVLDYIGKLDVAERVLPIGQVRYEVGVKYREEIHDRVLYIGKRRALSDSPMKSDENLDESELEIEDGFRIVEPCYLHPVGNSERGIVSYYKSSNGPHWSAVAKLLNLMAVKTGKPEVYELLALSKENPELILERALGAKSIDFKVDRLSTDIPAKNDKITQAVESIYQEFEGQVAVSMKLSFETGKPTAKATLLTSVVKRLARSSAVDKLETNLMLPTDDERDYRTEVVNMMKDIVAYDEDLVEKDQRVSVPDILIAIARAEGRLKSDAQEQNSRFTI